MKIQTNKDINQYEKYLESQIDSFTIELYPWFNNLVTLDKCDIKSSLKVILEEYRLKEPLVCHFDTLDKLKGYLISKIRSYLSLLRSRLLLGYGLEFTEEGNIEYYRNGCQTQFFYVKFLDNTMILSNDFNVPSKLVNRFYVPRLPQFL